MQSEIQICCGEQPTYLFVYENDTVLGICDVHYTSLAHRCFVKLVIDVKTHQKHLPSMIFEEAQIG